MNRIQCFGIYKNLKKNMKHFSKGRRHTLMLFQSIIHILTFIISIILAAQARKSEQNTIYSL